MGYDLKNISVLVVEDHDYMRKMIRDILFQWDIRQVHICKNPDDSFNRFQEVKIDLVITDWSPGLNGIHLLTRMRQDPDSPDPYVPVIIVTAHTDINHICIARDSGVTEFLAKPFSAKQIYERIRAVIERHRQFIRNSEFFGPDRRRRFDTYDGQERREELTE